MAQGSNFGIGLEGTGTTNNVVEENTIFGNSNGLYLAAAVLGNIIHRNLITGNPSVQVSTDNPSGSGLDIKNLAPPGANAFVGNVCQTAMNATCGLVGPSLNANPNPIPVSGGAIVGVTTLSWDAPGAQVIEIHVGAPDGPLFTRMGNRGSAQTGAWVRDGITFYLQDVSGGNPLSADYTLATAMVNLQKSSAAHFYFHGGRRRWAGGVFAILMGLALGWVWHDRPGSRAKRLRSVLGGAVLLAGIVFLLSQTAALAQPSASAQQTAATMDKMIAARKSRQELANYLFDTHGCKNCHTMGHEGKLGYTKKGEQRAKGFEGCINMLTAMTVIVQTPEEKRSAQQRQKAARFEEFGCTECHRLAPGKMSLTEVGAKLQHLHLGCVDIEKLTSGSAAPQR